MNAMSPTLHSPGLSEITAHIFTELCELSTLDPQARARHSWVAAVSITGLPTEFAQNESAAVAAIARCSDIAAAAGGLRSILDEALAAAAAGLALAYREALGPYQVDEHFFDRINTATST